MREPPHARAVVRAGCGQSGSVGWEKADRPSRQRRWRARGGGGAHVGLMVRIGGSSPGVPTTPRPVGAASAASAEYAVANGKTAVYTAIPSGMGSAQQSYSHAVEVRSTRARGGWTKKMQETLERQAIYRHRRPSCKAASSSRPRQWVKNKRGEEKGGRTTRCGNRADSRDA